MSERPAPEGFVCPYADEGRARCPEWRCDCFVDAFPEDPFGLHPEAFLVNGHQYNLEGHADSCPCHKSEGA